MDYHNNIDKVITEYDIRTDPILTTIWPKITSQMWQRIEGYGSGINNYGQDTLAPHLTRISNDSSAFLKYKGYEAHIIANFYDAIKISDLGKTHQSFDVNIWKLPNKPTEEQRKQKRNHTHLGLDVLQEFLKSAPQQLLEHPHITTVIPIHMERHHDKLSDNTQMGELMEVACLIDAYDGDMDNEKITHGSGATRTPAEQYKRMIAENPNDKYYGQFRKELVEEYFQFRLEHRNLTI